ncbi:MAG: beta strand repeat-containing protein [Tepidisphaerales bacterium]
MSRAVIKTLRGEAGVLAGRGLGGGAERGGSAGGALAKAEALEARRLLTTLFGGDIFEFSAPDPANPSQRVTNRIILSGNITAELIGGSIDPLTGQVVISDVPGAFLQSQIRGIPFSNVPQAPVLGGVGGGIGVQPLGPGITIFSPPPFDDQGQVLYTGGSAAFNVRSFAVAPNGTYYAFNVVKIGTQGQAGERSIVQLLRVEQNGGAATVIAELNPRISSLTAGSNFVDANGVEAITAAAFDPLSGRLFFVVRGNDRGAVVPPPNTPPPPAPEATQQLFSLEVTPTSTPAQILASVQAVPGSFNRTVNVDTIVNALTFDRQGNISRPVGFIVLPSGNATQGGIFDVNLGNTNIINNYRAVTSGLQDTAGNLLNLTGITGLAFIDDDPAVRDQFVYAVESNAQGTALGAAAPVIANQAIGPQVLLINRNNGQARQLGALTPPQTAADAAVLGANLQSLAFDPVRRNPFTGRLGVLLSIDNTVDQLAFVDSRNRLSNVTAFSLYIAQSDSTGSIVMAQVPDFNPQQPNVERPMQPFTGSAGTLRVNSANGQGIINLTSPSGIGGVFLGLKTSGNTNADLNNIPIITGQLAQALGVRGAGPVTAGVVTSASLLQALTNQGTLTSRLIGSNVSNVTGIAVNNAGQVFVVDSDGVLPNGQFFDGDQLYQISRTTGQSIGTPVNIVLNNAAATPMTNNRGITIADDPERILAVFLQQFPDATSGGTEVVGAERLPGAVDFEAVDGTPLSLAISGPGPTGFILVETATRKLLYRFQRVGGGDVIFTNLGPIVDADNNAVAAARALGVDSAGRLFTVGFTRGNPLPQQSANGSVDTSGQQPRNLTYASDGNLYLVSAVGGGFTVQQVNRDVQTGQLLGLGPAVQILSTGRPVLEVRDVTSDPVNLGRLLLAGLVPDSPLPTRSLGVLTGTGNVSNFVYRGVTRLNSTTVYAVTSNGSTLNLRAANLTPSLATVPGTFNTINRGDEGSRPGGATPLDDIRYDAPGSASGATTAVLGIRDTDARPGDLTGIWGVGVGADQLVPTFNATNPSLGNLGGSPFQNLSMSRYSAYTRQTDTGDDLSVGPFSNYTTRDTLNGGPYPYSFSRFAGYNRDSATGGIQSGGVNSVTLQVVGQSWTGTTDFPIHTGDPSSIPVNRSIDLQGVLAGNFTPNPFGTVSNGIVDTVAIGTANNALAAGADQRVVYTVGFNIDSPVPAAPIRGTLGNAFGIDPNSGESNVRAIVFDPVNTANKRLEDAYAIVFTTAGQGVDFYRLTRNEATGAISSFTRLNTDPRGLLDDNGTPNPADDVPINFVYTMAADRFVANRYYIVGSPTPGAGTAEMFLYSVDVVGNSNPVVTRISAALDSPAGFVYKAAAMDQTGLLYLVYDGDGGVPGINNAQLPNSILVTYDLTTNTFNEIGPMSALTFAGNIPASSATALTGRNSDVRAMSFHYDTIGDETLVTLDRTAEGLVEYNFNPSVPLTRPGGLIGTSTTIDGLPSPPNPVTAVVGLQSSLPGLLPAGRTQLNGGLSTFAIDQYGRGYAVQTATGPGNDLVLVSPNELFVQEISTSAQDERDGDNWAGEATRVAWLVNEDGTAFTDTVTALTQDLRVPALSGQQGGFVAVVRNMRASSLRPETNTTLNPTWNVDRLATLQFPAGAGTLVTPQVNSTTPFTVRFVRPAGDTNPVDDGIITVNGNVQTQTPGTPSNIRGLAFINTGDGLPQLIGLSVDNFVTGGNPRLVSFGLLADLNRLNDPTLNNPRFNTRALTDPSDTGFTTSNPRGFSADILGRFYSVDATTTPGAARLLGSPSRASLFRINVANATATRFLDLAEQLDPTGQQPPVSISLTPFNAFAFRDANTVFMVQRDVRNRLDEAGQLTTNFIPLDRLVNFTIPSVIPDLVTYTRFNAGGTAGEIRAANPPSEANPVPLFRRTFISAMDFAADGSLFALDQLENRLVAINLTLAAPGLPPSQAPANSLFVTAPDTTTGFAGYSILGNQTVTVRQDVDNEAPLEPDVLLVTTGDYALYRYDPETETTSDVGGLVLPNGLPLTDQTPITALASLPGSSLIYAIVRAVDEALQPADFLYTISAETRVMSLIGRVTLVRNAAGAVIPPTNTRLVSIDFSGDRDAGGNLVLMGVHDPGTDGGGDRQLVRIGITTATVGQSEVVRGSVPGSVADGLVGFASDVVAPAPLQVPATDIGRFYALNVANPANTELLVTPTRVYQYLGTGATFGNVANVRNVGGGPVLQPITALDFNAADQLFGVRSTALGTSSLVSFPPLPPVTTGTPTTLTLGGGQSIFVSSAATTPLQGFPPPLPILSPEPTNITAMFFLGDGTLRAVDRGQLAPRLIDINIANPGLSVARTDVGVPDPNFVGGDFVGGAGSGAVFYLDNTTPNAAQLIVDLSGTGAASTGVLTLPTLGVPVLGTINPTTGVFTPANTGNLETPGRLPPSISDVKAIAFDRTFGTSRPSAGLYIIDQDDRLLQISPTNGAIIRIVGTVRDAFSNAPLNIGSMSFDRDGRLIAQDVDNARLVDISTVTAIAGAVASSPTGSLPPTVGGLAFDNLGNRFLAADNATGINLGAVGFNTSSQIKQFAYNSAGNFTVVASDVDSVFIGGTVLGRVDFGGSVGRFYAGWLITGSANGLSINAANPQPGNFRVAGDLGELIVLGPIGTAGVADDILQTQYFTGTDIFVSGRIGTVRSDGDVLATIRSSNSRVRTSLPLTQSEAETRFVPPGTELVVQQGRAFAQRRLLLPVYNNDTFETAQRLRFGSNPDGSPSGTVTISGALEMVQQADFDGVDYFALPLLAGQTISFAEFSSLGLGVFDPDGRLVFTNYTLNGVAAFAESALRFTADRPGEYRIAIARLGDFNFNGVADPGEPPLALGVLPYSLTVSNVGDLAISAITTAGTLFDNGVQGNATNFNFSAVYAGQGDIGGVFAGARIMGRQVNTSNTVRADGTGSIRSIEAGQIGELRQGNYIRGATIAAGGNVGLIRSTAGVLVLNQNVQPNLANTGTTSNFNPEVVRVGGSIQIIDAAGTFFGNVFANGGLGNLRAGDMATLRPSFINVNADNTGFDGVIDLIDVAGQLGTAAGGGPVIYTNAGGNVRYLRAGGPVFRDAAFGSGAVSEIFLTPGQPLNFTDDSGSALRVEFDEGALVPNPAFDPNDPASPRFLNAPQIGYLAYPMRSGGAAMMILQVSGLGTPSNLSRYRTPNVRFITSGAGNSFEVADLVLRGVGSAVVNNGGVLSQPGTTDGELAPRITVRLEGGARFDLFRLDATAGTHLHYFRNETLGELLSMVTDSIGTLSYRGDIGIARPGNSGVAVLPRVTGTPLAYPFTGVGTLISTTGDNSIIRIESGGAIGNVLVGGSVGEIQANFGGSDIPDRFEGIAGPIVVTGFLGSLFSGEGIAPAGSGAVAGGFVFAGGPITRVTAAGDIMGVIASQTSIDEVYTRGALIESLITVGASGLGLLGLTPLYNSVNNNIALVGDFGNINRPNYEIRRVRADQGVIGSRISALDIEFMTAAGFGLVSSRITSGGDGVLNQLIANGYGIRGASINGFSRIGRIQVNGNGSQLSTNAVTPSVRRSEFETTSSLTGQPLTPFTDIHLALSTSAATPVIPGVTDTGVVESLDASGNQNLTSLTAWSIRGTTPGQLNTVLGFAGRIGTISTRSVINGLTVIAGSVGTFSPGSDVLALNMTVAGAFNNLRINGNLANNSRIELNGPSSSLGNLVVRGNFEGSLVVSGRVNSINISGNLVSADPATPALTISPAGAVRGNVLGRLTVGGSIVGNVTINGSVGTVSVPGSLGVAGNTFTITGNLAALNVGTNRRLPPGQLMAMNVTVGGTVGTVNVRGRMTGALTATGSIRNIRVQSDGSPDRDLVAGDVTSLTGDIQALTVSGGDIAANVTAFNRLRTVTVQGGSVKGGTTLGTVAGDIGNISVRGGNLLGSVRSGDEFTTGLKPIANLNVDGQLGDGTTAYSIKASSIRQLRVRGSVFSSTDVNTPEVLVSGNLNQLIVNGNVGSGVTIRAGSISRQQIGGTVDGEIIVG